MWLSSLSCGNLSGLPWLQVTKWGCRSVGSSLGRAAGTIIALNKLLNYDLLCYAIISYIGLHSCQSPRAAWLRRCHKILRSDSLSQAHDRHAGGLIKFAYSDSCVIGLIFTHMFCQNNFDTTQARRAWRGTSASYVTFTVTKECHTAAPSTLSNST
jgi:hypothetical protein